MMAAKQEAIKKMAQQGVLISPDAADMLAAVSESDAELLADACKERGVITGEDIRKILFKQREDFSVVKNVERTSFTGKGEIPHSYYKDKYEKMRQVVMERIDKSFVSISNIAARGEFYIIGMIRDIVEGEYDQIVVEDATGSVGVRISDKALLKNCEIDDVVAVKAVAAGPQIFGKEVIFPGIPVRTPAVGQGKALFVSNPCLDEAPPTVMRDISATAEKHGAEWIFVTGNVGNIKMLEEGITDKTVFLSPGETDGKGHPQPPMETKKRNIISLSSPAMVSVGGLKILMCHNFEKSWLEKRHLGNPNTGVLEDSLVLDIIPDIVHYSSTKKPEISYYKSITIVNGGSALTEMKPVLADFSERTESFVRIGEG